MLDPVISAKAGIHVSELACVVNRVVGFVCNHAKNVINISLIIFSPAHIKLIDNKKN